MENIVKLGVSISEDARKKLKESGNEGYITVKRMGGGWSSYYAALVEGGKPANLEGYFEVKDGDVDLWVPKGMAFQSDTIDIQVMRSIWGSKLIVKSAMLPTSGCSGCK